MQVTVPSIVETQLTGRLGEVEQSRGAVMYRVFFTRDGEGQLCAGATRNGDRVPFTFNATVAKLVAAGSRLFMHDGRA